MPRRARDELRAVRPDVAALIDANGPRISVARRLRVARKRAGLSPAQVAEASGMSRAAVLDMESPTGAMPAQADTDRYMRACR